MLKQRLRKLDIRVIFMIKYLIMLKNKMILKNNKIAEKYLEIKYLKKIGKKFKFNSLEKTFTQKIQVRKLYPKNSLFTICADKYLVRDYVREKIGEEYLIPLYLVTDKLTLDQWKELPNSFVVKPNHDSGNFEVITDKVNLSKRHVKQILLKMNLALKINFGWYALERHYIGIKPRIIVEELLLTKDGELPTDYKFYCLKNKIIIQVVERDISTHEYKIKFYDEEFEELNLKREGKELKRKEKPSSFGKMIEIAKCLSKEFNFVRVDLYELEGKIYFGELTFTPASGFMKFTPKIWDNILGKYWSER